MLLATKVVEVVLVDIELLIITKLPVEEQFLKQVLVIQLAQIIQLL